MYTVAKQAQFNSGAQTLFSVTVIVIAFGSTLEWNQRQNNQNQLTHAIVGPV